MKKTFMFVMLLILSTHVQASSKFTIPPLKLLQAVYTELRQNNKLLAQIANSGKIFAARDSRCSFGTANWCWSNPCTQCQVRRSPQIRGFTRCILGNPNNFCESWPCNNCVSEGLPPQAKKGTRKPDESKS